MHESRHIYQRKYFKGNNNSFDAVVYNLTNIIKKIIPCYKLKYNKLPLEFDANLYAFKQSAENDNKYNKKEKLFLYSNLLNSELHKILFNYDKLFSFYYKLSKLGLIIKPFNILYNENHKLKSISEIINSDVDDRLLMYMLTNNKYLKDHNITTLQNKDAEILREYLEKRREENILKLKQATRIVKTKDKNKIINYRIKSEFNKFKEKSTMLQTNFNNLLEKDNQKPIISKVNINTSERAKIIFKENLLMSRDVVLIINNNTDYKKSRRDLINELNNYKEELLNRQIEDEIISYKEHKILK